MLGIGVLFDASKVFGTIGSSRLVHMFVLLLEHEFEVQFEGVLGGLSGCYFRRYDGLICALYLGLLLLHLTILAFTQWILEHRF